MPCKPEVLQSITGVSSLSNQNVAMSPYDLLAVCGMLKQVHI